MAIARLSLNSTLRRLVLLSFPTRRSADLWNDILEDPELSTDARRQQVASGARSLFCVPIKKERAPLATCCRRASDRKSTRLNSSHVENSYAVSCLKKKVFPNQLLT